MTPAVPARWSLSPGREDPAVPATKTDAAYFRIRRRILDGRLAPGEPLDQERLAAELGLSTTPVREALRRLESERLVVGRAHRDTIVAPLPVELVKDVYQVRLALDPLAASLAAKHASSEQRAHVLALLAAAPDSPGMADHVHYNREFHRSVYSACGNRVLSDMLDTLWDITDRYDLINTHGETTGETDGEQHSAIAEAVAGRRPGNAARLMQAHVNAATDAVLDQVFNKTDAF